MTQTHAKKARVLMLAVSQERTGLAAAMIVAVLLVGLFRAPAWPVFGGCLAALLFFLGRSYFRLKSGPR
jgi:hypothetical protein